MKQIVKKFNDKTFGELTEDYLDKLKSIAVALGKLQYEEALISDAVEVWHKLVVDLQSC